MKELFYEWSVYFLLVNSVNEKMKKLKCLNKMALVREILISGDKFVRAVTVREMIFTTARRHIGDVNNAIHWNPRSWWNLTKDIKIDLGCPGNVLAGSSLLQQVSWPLKLLAHESEDFLKVISTTVVLPYFIIDLAGFQRKHIKKYRAHFCHGFTMKGKKPGIKQNNIRQCKAESTSPPKWDKTKTYK